MPKQDVGGGRRNARSRNDNTIAVIVDLIDRAVKAVINIVTFSTI